MLDDLDLGDVVAVVEEVFGALGETEAVSGGEEREEEAVALWLDVMVEEGAGEGRGRSGFLMMGAGG